MCKFLEIDIEVERVDEVGNAEWYQMLTGGDL